MVGYLQYSCPVVPIVECCRCGHGRSAGSRALAVSDDGLDPGQESLHPRVDTWVLCRAPTAIAHHTKEHVLSILGNGKGSTTIPLAGVGTLGPGTKHRSGG